MRQRLLRLLVLASRSPRRVELLHKAGFEFEIDPADIDESNTPAGLSPTGLAVWLAQAKASVVAKRRPDAIVIGADTVVAVGDVLYGKAQDAEHARRMLFELSGTSQHVITGIALVGVEARLNVNDFDLTVVQFASMTSTQIDAYVASNQWQGKAGAYGIQDEYPQGDRFATLVEGEWDNVVGLPLKKFEMLLSKATLT